jgi:hypothetical protein
MRFGIVQGIAHDYAGLIDREAATAWDRGAGAHMISLIVRARSFEVVARWVD